MNTGVLHDDEVLTNGIGDSGILFEKTCGTGLGLTIAASLRAYAERLRHLLRSRIADPGRVGPGRLRQGGVVRRCHRNAGLTRSGTNPLPNGPGCWPTGDSMTVPHPSMHR